MFLSGNDTSCIASDLAVWCENHGIGLLLCAPCIIEKYRGEACRLLSVLPKCLRDVLIVSRQRPRMTSALWDMAACGQVATEDTTRATFGASHDHMVRRCAYGFTQRFRNPTRCDLAGALPRAVARAT
ncbi:MAG: hypothetical protein RIR33_2020 [Pseudomonadota bacterium]